MSDDFEKDRMDENLMRIEGDRDSEDLKNGVESGTDSNSDSDGDSSSSLSESELDDDDDGGWGQPIQSFPCVAVGRTDSAELAEIANDGEESMDLFAVSWRSRITPTTVSTISDCTTPD